MLVIQKFCLYFQQYDKQTMGDDNYTLLLTYVLINNHELNRELVKKKQQKIKYTLQGKKKNGISAGICLKYQLSCCLKL
jgi:hypothetical protein